MWDIDHLEFPFYKAKSSLEICVSAFIDTFRIPYDLLSEIMARIILDNTSFLTVEEICDVETSWEEIEQGQAKKFTNVDDFLRELKS